MCKKKRTFLPNVKDFQIVQAKMPSSSNAFWRLVKCTDVMVNYKMDRASELARFSLFFLCFFITLEQTKMPLCGKKETKSTGRKLVVCGDGACGKTSLLEVFTRDHFPEVCVFCLIFMQK